MAYVKKAACPLNCWDSCGLMVTIENDRVIKVEGDPDHPITKGKICGRGRMLEKRTNSKLRLLHPMKKINGTFKEISWEQALDEIADRLKEIKECYGTTAVLHSHDYANNGILKNLDQRFFNCYGGVTELYGSLCWGSGIEAQKWDFGNALSHEPEDIFNSKNIVVWGRNVARTNMHLYEKLLEAKKRGAKLFVIDPIYHATAKIADQFISIKPGMDGILAAGIMKEMLRLGLEDRTFIEQYTYGFQDLLKLLHSISLETVSEMTEVPLEVITQLAGVYADKPVSTYMGLGLQRYKNGGNTIRLIDALVAVSGNIGVPGGGANYANLQVGQSFAYDQLTLPERRQNHRLFSIMKQAEEVLSARDPEIKMIMVTCGNPITQVPDSRMVKKAFKSVETLVVMDQYMTDTAKLADYILPVTTAFEEEDFYFSSMYHHYVNYGPKLVSAPGEAKPDLWIWTQLANRLGFGKDFDFSRDEWLKMTLKPLEQMGLTLEKLKQKHTFELPVSKVPWQDRKFQTPTGKFEFTSILGQQKGKTGLLTLAVPDESKWSNPSLAEQYPYNLLTIHPMRSNHSQNYHLLNGHVKLKVEVAENIAQNLGLQNGDYVRVWNDRGEVKGYVSVLGTLHPDTINIDEGIWEEFGGPVNNLTSSRESDNGLGSTLYDCLVNLEKVN
ncbi:molybdopterin-dependent oxidoreductase [Neobacillus thermocopriae]|uniref:Molybdopterin-dependent oxidoreductase n=1 Tax=Neobacillus thermocopriae TaxID=1215031 RepID=A0A6B3TS87_9BACI|nr:molybdopterin-dependent oxidoreductase [Neobacillus thermocopriae]MED3623722.1 molybdopterin-dependent oxidoreductase [Neobacillus thermocopriae]MED3715580.1 molybdopterin-dependent oxidoreductase [Neobacillus thermocopriae]NEX79438.1 molybdopterin-dependent oxidoreductase [Neobacillus thermocopriae]